MKKLFSVVLFSVVLLISCNSNSEESFNLSNMINDSDVDTENAWIGYEGQVHKHSQFYVSESIDYNSDNEYEIDFPGYVAYYNDDEFLTTVQYQSNEVPKEIDSIEDANNIKISYRPEEIN